MKKVVLRIVLQQSKVSTRDHAELMDLLQTASDARYGNGCCPRDGDMCEWHQRLFDVEEGNN